MNFDGKSLVVDKNVETFFSDNGSAIVLPVLKQEYNCSMSESNVDRIDLIFNNSINIGDSNTNLTEGDFYNRPVGLSQFTATVHVGPKLGEVPFTAQVYSELKTRYDDKLLPPFTKVYIFDKSRKNDWISYCEARVQIHDTISRYSKDIHMYDFISTKIHDITVPTNLFIVNQETAFIIDCVHVEKEKDFPIVSANIVDKTEISIPSPSKGYQDMFLVVQKNNFIELKLSDTIINVTGLPEGLEYTLNTIKGIIARSGSYDIRIQYQESAQKLNIIVPYYERTL